LANSDISMHTWDPLFSRGIGHAVRLVPEFSLMVSMKMWQCFQSFDIDHVVEGLSSTDC
jgi:hypothetical protein